MFKWLNKQGVESDRGFIVQFTSRFTAEYREPGGRVTLDVELGMSGGKICVSVEPNAFDRWDNGAAIPPDKRAEMFQNLKEAIEFQGLKLVVEKGMPPPGF